MVSNCLLTSLTISLAAMADRLHGHGGKRVRDHGADEEERKDDGFEERHLVEGEARASGERAKEGETDEAGRSDRESLSDGGSSVASSVERISLVAHVLGELSHLGDAAGVVADGTVDVDGQAGREVGEHAKGGESDAKHVENSNATNTTMARRNDGNDGRLVAESEAVDDVGGGARFARLRDFAGGVVAVGRSTQ